MLEHVDIGWVWLKEHLDRIIDEVNQNKPLASSTIAIDVNTSGSMLRTVPGNQADQQQQPSPPQTDTPWKITPDGETASWHEVIAFNPANFNLEKRWVWGGSPSTTINSWEVVVVVDPSTCAQSTITLLGHP